MISILSLRVAAACVAAILTTSCAGDPKTTAAAPQPTAGLGGQSLPESATGYYGVYTTSTVVLFGKVVRSNDDWITLADVHYIRSNVDADKKQVANQLVKRMREWHQPAETSIARGHILVLEPVAQDSRMMSLISEMRSK